MENQTLGICLLFLAVADTKNAYTLISAVITLARSSLGLFVKSTPEQASIF
jgi:hypothetical protein